MQEALSHEAKAIEYGGREDEPSEQQHRAMTLFQMRLKRDALCYPTEIVIPHVSRKESE